MSITTAKQFLALLEKSRLLKSKYLDVVRGAAEKDPPPKALAGRLVKKGLLSRWQAKQLLAGHASFFLGDYRLIESLSPHPGGRVYLAEHRRLGRRVVLKRLPREIMGNAERKKQAVGAVRAAVRMDHENLARVYSIEQAGDRYYVISQYIEGRDLAATVEQAGPLEFADAAAAIIQAARGLAEIHRCRAVHAGIRPSNLVVSPEGQVKLVAAATARRYEPTDDSEPGPAILDAVNYAAPELLESGALPTAASDIYSLGCTLYFLLTGKPPFAEGSAADRAAAHIRHQPPGILRARADVPDILLKTCRSMLAKRPEGRPGSAEEVAQRLAEFQPPKRKADRIVATVSVRRPPAKASAPKMEDNTANGREEPGEVDAPVAAPAAELPPKAEPQGQTSESTGPEPGDDAPPKVASEEPSKPAKRPPKRSQAAKEPAAVSETAPKPPPMPIPKEPPARADVLPPETAEDATREAPAPKSDSPFAIDTGQQGPAGRPIRSRAAGNKSQRRSAGGSQPSLSWKQRHGKALWIGGGSLVALLLAAAVALPLLLGGSTNDPTGSGGQAAESRRAEQPDAPTKPAGPKDEDLIDELDLDSPLDLNLDDFGIGLPDE